MASSPESEATWPESRADSVSHPTAASTASGLLSREALSVGGVILGWKLATLAVVVVAAALLPFDKVQYEHHFRYPDSQPIDLRLHFKTWDGEHYLYLVDASYNPGQGSNAFYPLLPLLIRGAEATGLAPVPAGLLVTNVVSFGALALFYAFVRRFWGRQVAWPTLLLVLAFPTAYYLNLIYTEGLFLLLAIACVYGLQQRNYNLAALAGFLLPFVRFVGIFALIPMALSLYRDRRDAAREGRSPPSYLWLLAPLLALALYFAYMQASTGDALVAQHSQRFYDANRSVANLIDPGAFLSNLFRSDLTLHGYRNSLLDRAFFVGFLVSLPLVYRRVELPLFGLFLALGLIPLLGSFESYMRYLMIAFPLYIAAGAWLAERRPLLLRGTLVGMGALQVVFLASHSLNHWVA